MSTTSLLGQLAEREGAEYPFPTVGDHTLQRPESLSTGSSDSDFTPPYLARSLPSHHSSSSRHRHRTRNDRPHRARNEDEDGNGDNTSTKLLSQLVSRSNLRDVKQVRTLLILTNDRLEAETRRADQAEQRVVDALHRLRSANEATALAQADASRAQQQVRLYELQIQQAQSEINRAQEIVNEVERARRDAEEEAARARSVARKCKEQYVSAKAREEGRQEGYLEGLARGRTLGFSEAQGARVVSRQGGRKVILQNEDEDDESEESEEPEEPRVEARKVEQRRSRQSPVPASVPWVHRISPPPPAERYMPPPGSIQPSRHTSPEHPSDVAPFTSTLPFPTLITPLHAPSPSHIRPAPQTKHQPPHQTRIRSSSPSHTPVRPSISGSPRPLPVPVPRRTPEQDPGPIAVHNIPPSPSHPRVDVPPDGWIPYAANNDSSTILIPPPHELSGAVSPVDPSPTRSEAPLPVPNQVPYSVPGPSGSYRSNDVQPPQYASSVQSRDYAFGGAPLPIKPPSTGLNSPQSTRPSTMSQYDLLVPPPNQERIYRQGVDRQSIMAGSGPADEPPRPVRMHARQENAESHDDGRSPLGKIFRNRFKAKRAPSSAQTVPQITVESPSTETVSRPSTVMTTTEPHLLSPDQAHKMLPTLTDILGSQSHPHSPKPLPIPPKPIASGDIQSPGTAPIYHSTAPGSRSYSPYITAPVPSNIVYPDPPGRPKSRSSKASSSRVPVLPSFSDETLGSGSYRSRKRQDSVTDSLGTLGGRLSPLSLPFGQQFSSFTIPDR